MKLGSFWQHQTDRDCNAAGSRGHTLRTRCSHAANANGSTYKAQLVFFGLWCIVTGYLIFKSTFLPRVIGVLLMISGLGWIIHLLPPIANHLFPFIAGASALGEIPLEFWLMVMAVNSQGWKEQAGR